MESENRGRTRSGSKASQGSYLVVISNLPLKLDIQSHTKYSTISWRPIKDLLRNVINKREDGTDIRPQEGNPGTVHVWPESDGQCGYAMGTLQKRKHAMRALHWLGGNLWYGRTLSVILYYDGAEGLQYIDSRWMKDTTRPIKLECIVSVSQKELLQRQPSCETPNMLLCLVPKGSIFARQRFSGSLDAYNDEDSWGARNPHGMNRPYPEPQEGYWYPNEAFTNRAGCEYFPGRFHPTWAGDNSYSSNWYSTFGFRPYGGYFIPPKPVKEKRHRGNFSPAPLTGLTPGSSSESFNMFPMDRTLPSSDDESVSAPTVSDTSSSSLRSVSTSSTVISGQVNKPAGPIIADGSEVDLALEVTSPQLAIDKQRPNDLAAM